jgi:hypothetical protein
MGLDLAGFPSSHPLFIPGNPFFVRPFASRHSACFKTKGTIRLNSPINCGLHYADDIGWDRFGQDFYFDASQAEGFGSDSDDSDDDSEDEEPRPALMNRGLSLCCLRVCRQIYAEARHLPYTSNTFAFRSTKTYKHFTPSLLETQRRLITKLNLLVINPNIGTQEYPHWVAWSGVISSVPLLGNLITDLHINYEISYSKAKRIKSIAPTTASGPPDYPKLGFLATCAMSISSDCRITTIVADMYKSLSYESWLRMPIELSTSLSFGGYEGKWRQWREQNCLTVGEKRQIVVWINEAVGTKREPKDKSKQ